MKEKANYGDESVNGIRVVDYSDIDSFISDVRLNKNNAIRFISGISGSGKNFVSSHLCDYIVDLDAFCSYNSETFNWIANISRMNHLPANVPIVGWCDNFGEVVKVVGSNSQSVILYWVTPDYEMWKLIMTLKAKYSKSKRQRMFEKSQFTYDQFWTYEKDHFLQAVDDIRPTRIVRYFNDTYDKIPVVGWHYQNFGLSDFEIENVKEDNHEQVK